MNTNLRHKLFQDRPLDKDYLKIWLLGIGHLKKHKYFLSIEKNYSVTVPEAVDDFLKKCPYDGMEQDEEFLSGKLRTSIVAGYLLTGGLEPLIFNVKQCGVLSTARRVWQSESAWHEGLAQDPSSFISSERASRLEGELRRFGAQIYQKDPRDVTVTPELIQNYCQRCNILSLQDEMMKEFRFSAT